MSKQTIHCIALALLLLACRASAGDADSVPLKDLAWGTDGNGIAYRGFDLGSNLSDEANAGILLPDGRLVMAGLAQIADLGVESRYDFAFSQMLPGDGAPDPEFGAGSGALTLGLTSFRGQLDLTRRADGRLLFAAHPTESTAMIGQLLADGTPDIAFDLDGRRLVGASAFLDAADRVYSALVVGLADGKSLLMVAIARNVTPPIRECIGVMRLNADGSTDTSFGAGSGRVCHAPVNEGIAAAAGSALQVLADGRILITGFALHSGGSSADMATLRLLPDGAIDTGFGEDGWAFVGFDQGGALADVAWALAVDASDRIVIAGYADNKSDDDIGVARLLPDGAIDTSFGIQGRVLIDFGALAPSGYESANSLLILPDQRLLIGGNDGYATGLMAMLGPDGTLDPWFGTGGRFVQSTSADPQSEQVYAYELLRHQDYLYLVGKGKTPADNSNGEFAAARFILPLFRGGFEAPDEP